MLKLFSQRQRSAALEAVRNAPEHYIVEIKPRTRSLEQNAMLWRLLTITSQSVPWTVNGSTVMLSPEDWKAVFTSGLYEETRIAKGLRGGFVALGMSTSRMPVSQMADLISFIESFLAEQGVDING